MTNRGLCVCSASEAPMTQGRNRNGSYAAQKLFRLSRFIILLLFITFSTYAAFCFQYFVRTYNKGGDEAFVARERMRPNKSTESKENNLSYERMSKPDDPVNKTESGGKNHSQREVPDDWATISGKDLYNGLGRNSTTYGLIVGPFDSTEERILKTRPTGGCDKNGEFARVVRGKKFVLVMHELTMTGAPISAMELATELLSCEATVSVVALNRKGGLMGELQRRKINVVKDAKNVSFTTAVEADVVIPVSAVSAYWIEQYRATFPGSQSENIVWWIMENLPAYYKVSRETLNKAQVLIFLLESQAKEWQSWCARDNISLDSQEIAVAPLAVNDELAFVAGFSTASDSSTSSEVVLEYRKELRKAVRAEMGLKDSDMVVMCLGSINPAKGQLLLLESAAQMLAKNGSSSESNLREVAPKSEQGLQEQTTLKILIGSLWSMSSFRSYIEPMLRVIYQHPTLTGLVLWTPSSTHVAALYSAADVYVVNSQRNVGETFGRVTIEAMAFGLPVVGTDAGGTPYIVDNNKTGLLHPLGQSGIPVLAQNLQFLLENPLARQEMGARGREKVEKMYLKRHMLEKLAGGISRLKRRQQDDPVNKTEPEGKNHSQREVPADWATKSGKDLFNVFGRNRTAYGLIVGPFGSTEERILKTIPTGGCNKNGEFARVVRGRKFVVVMHDLSMTGAPISAMELATELMNCGATVSVVVLARGGPLMQELNKRKINVVKDAKSVSFRTAVEADVVIPISAVSASWIEQYRATFPGSQSENIAWWIMENLRMYYELSRHTLNKVKMLIFLIESQAKEWQSWCAEDKISLDSQEIAVAPLSVNDELAFVAGFSSSASSADMLEKRKELRKAVRDEMGLKDSDVVVMCLGSINPIKGQLNLLQSAAQMLAKNGSSSESNTREGGLQEQTTLKILIGSLVQWTRSWPYIEEMLRVIYQHPKMDGLVFWTPPTTHVSALYCATDAYVINSQENAGETFGRVTIEAMAFGLPILGTDAGGTKSIVDHNKTGLLHPLGQPGNPVLAQNLQFLLENPSVRQEMGARGREKVEKMYLKQHMLEKLAGGISRFKRKQDDPVNKTESEGKNHSQREVPADWATISGKDLFNVFGRNSTAYGLIVGPFGSTEDRILKTIPTGGCDKNGEFARVVRGRKFVVVMHDLSMTGAPISAMELATELMNCEATVSVVVLARGGPLMGELKKRKINVVKDAKSVSFRTAVEADVVIPISAVSASWIEKYRATFPGSQSENIAWWIMENLRMYYELSRSTLNKVKMLIFLIESQAKEWQSWCAEDKISLDSQEIAVAPLSVNDELAFVAGFSSSASSADMLEKRKELRKAVREEMGLKDSDVVVMCLGSINPIKGQLNLLQSAAQMLAKNGSSSNSNTREGGLQEQTTLKILIGSLVQWKSSWSYIEEMLRVIYQNPKLDGLVFWTPPTTHVAALYCAADAYVINSQENAGETFGRVTIEAMAFGLPILGTDAGGTKSIVDHNKTGLLHPLGQPGNPVLAQNLQFLLENPSVRQEMGARGREKVEKMYLKRHMLEKLAGGISRFKRKQDAPVNKTQLNTT